MTSYSDNVQTAIGIDIAHDRHHLGGAYIEAYNHVLTDRFIHELNRPHGCWLH
jgi:hypothetical protein